MTEPRVLDTAVATAGGRGARGRVLAAAVELFYEQGINTTGVKQLTDTAHVSTRTFYQHFPSKQDLVLGYLMHWDTELLLHNEASLSRLSRRPRARLLGLFHDPPAHSLLRGCPFHNAAVELGTDTGPVRSVITAHKHHFLETVTATVAEMGVAAPRRLAQQLAVLYEGALAWGTSSGDRAAFRAARAAATILLDHAGQ